MLRDAGVTRSVSLDHHASRGRTRTIRPSLHPTKPVGRFFAREDADRLAREHGWRFRRGRRTRLSAGRAVAAAGAHPRSAGGRGAARRERHPHRSRRRRHPGRARRQRRLSRRVGGDRQGPHQRVARGRSRRRDVGDADRRRPRRARFRQAHAARTRLPDRRGGATLPGRRPVSPGSMGPKIAAALHYLDRDGRQVVITSLDRAYDALQGNAGTRIVP